MMALVQYQDVPWYRMGLSLSIRGLEMFSSEIRRSGFLWQLHMDGYFMSGYFSLWSSHSEYFVLRNWCCVVAMIAIVNFSKV